MIEIALPILANALVGGAMAFVASRRGRVRRPPFPLARSLAGGAIVGVAGALMLLLSRGHADRASMLSACWHLVAGFAGALAAIAGTHVASWRTEASDGNAAELRGDAFQSLAAPLVATLAMSVTVGAASLSGGAHAETALIVGPLVAGTFALALQAATPGAVEGSRFPALAESVVEPLAAMVVLAAAFDANSELFRASTVVARPVGLLMLPIVWPPLFALARVAAAVASPRSAHGFEDVARAALVVVILGTTTLGALGPLWLPFFFCAVVGVGSVVSLRIVGARLANDAMASIAALVVVVVATLASTLVAGRAGVAHSEAMSAVFVAAGARGACRDGRDKSADSSLRVAHALGAIAIAVAVVDSVGAATCARWLSDVALPVGDPVGALRRCDAAAFVTPSLDLARPSVALAAVTGCALVVYGHVERVRGVFVVGAAVALAALLGRAIDVGLATLGALALGAVFTSAAAPSHRRRATALFVASAAIVFAALVSGGG